MQILKKISEVQRRVIKGQLSKLKTYLETRASLANEFKVQTKFELLEDYFKKINIIQDNLDIIIGGEEDSSDREIVEELFFMFKSKLINKKADFICFI